MEGFNQVEQMESAKMRILQYETNKMAGVTGSESRTNVKTKPDSEKLRIAFKKEEFIATQGGTITTTLALGQKISNILGKFFADLAGAIILPDSKGQPELILYFKDVPLREGKYKGIITIRNKTANRNSGYSDSVNSVVSTTAQQQSSRVYDLTDEAREVLEKFMFRDGNGNINWNQKLSEQSANGVPGGEILVRLRGLNLIELVKSIYGYKYFTKGVNGEEEVNMYDFAITLISPLSTPYTYNTYNYGTNQTLTDYAVSISRIDRTELSKVAKIFGQPAVYGTTPMCIPQEM